MLEGKTGFIMPTKADLHAMDSGSCETRSCSSWTDDLPACQLSAVGFCASQTATTETPKNSEQTCQDCWFRFRPEPDTWVYGLLSALGGMMTADFARERLPAELLLGQLEAAPGDVQVRDVLRQGFLLVDRAFLQSIDTLLLNRATLQLQLQNVSAYELLTRQPMLADELSRVNRQISAACSASLAVLRRGLLFVAHVGLGRVLLVRKDGSTLSVEQLSVEHSVANEDELLRLVQLGLDPEALRAQPPPLTRCLGGYLLKAGHKESPLLREAKEEPVLAEPEICGGIRVDESCLYLLLLSEGLCQALKDAGMQDPNQEIAQMVDQEVSTQSSLARAAQTVVNRVALLQATSGGQRCQGGLTLLVRPLQQQPERREPAPAVDDPSGINVDTPESTLSSYESAGPTKALFRRGQKAPPPLDDEGRLEPYVDFGPFFTLAQEAVRQGTWPSYLEL
ncbi:unnamed protein product [Ixodes pacificus]